MAAPVGAGRARRSRGGTVGTRALRGCLNRRPCRGHPGRFRLPPRWQPGYRTTRARCARRSRRRPRGARRTWRCAAPTPRPRSPGASTPSASGAIAAGLAALGVGRGDTVALMLTNRIEFYPCDTAALHLGATPFSIYNTSSPEQIAYLFANAGNRVVITERAVPRAASTRPAAPTDRCATSSCRRRRDGDGAITLDELEARGAIRPVSTSRRPGAP